MCSGITFRAPAAMQDNLAWDLSSRKNSVIQLADTRIHNEEAEFD